MHLTTIGITKEEQKKNIIPYDSKASEMLTVPPFLNPIEGQSTWRVPT